MQINWNLLRQLVFIMLMATGNTTLHAQDHPLTMRITDTTLLKQVLNGQGITNKEVQIDVVTFAPGSSSAAHKHPCPTFGYILEGELESVFKGARHLYKKGETFYESAFGLHSLTRNNSLTEKAVLLVFFINDPAKPNSIQIKQ